MTSFLFPALVRDPSQRRIRAQTPPFHASTHVGTLDGMLLASGKRTDACDHATARAYARHLPCCARAALQSKEVVELIWNLTSSESKHPWTRGEVKWNVYESRKEVRQAGNTVRLLRKEDAAAPLNPPS